MSLRYTGRPTIKDSVVEHADGSTTITRTAKAHNWNGYGQALHNAWSRVMTAHTDGVLTNMHVLATGQDAPEDSSRFLYVTLRVRFA